MAVTPGSADPGSPAGAAGSRDITYETDAPNAYQWTEIAYNYLLRGELAASIRSAGGISTATVTGTCPHCRDDVNFSQVLDAVTGESMRTLGWRGIPSVPAEADDGYVALTVSCSCTEPHPGRPAGVSHGCGINFRVDVRRDS